MLSKITFFYLLLIMKYVTMTTNPTTARAPNTMPITTPSDIPSLFSCILCLTETELQMSLCYHCYERITL